MPIAQAGRTRPKNAVNTSRVRSPVHRAFIRKHPCAACGKPASYGDPIECAHVRMGHSGGLAVKPGDELTVPLHKTCHRIQGNQGERKFWAQRGIHNPVALALGFARRSPDRAVREAAT